MSKALQYFSDKYIEESSKLSSDNIASFLENFRLMHAPSKNKPKSKLISLKVREDLLKNFKLKAKLEGVRYQTKIKELMKDWLE